MADFFPVQKQVQAYVPVQAASTVEIHFPATSHNGFFQLNL